MAEFCCPICKKAARPGEEFFPFCSRRCKLVDLGSWLDESYRISKPLRPEEGAPAGGSPASLGGEAGDDEGD